MPRRGRSGKGTIKEVIEGTKMGVGFGFKGMEM